jgi:hypothetical protein
MIRSLDNPADTLVFVRRKTAIWAKIPEPMSPKQQNG